VKGGVDGGRGLVGGQVVDPKVIVDGLKHQNCVSKN
jgi:hypothetical protein